MTMTAAERKALNERKDAVIAKFTEAGLAMGDKQTPPEGAEWNHWLRDLRNVTLVWSAKNNMWALRIKSDGYSRARGRVEIAINELIEKLGFKQDRMLFTRNDTVDARGFRGPRGRWNPASISECGFNFYFKAE